jgi:hypothetical protein
MKKQSSITIRIIPKGGIEFTLLLLGLLLLGCGSDNGPAPGGSPGIGDPETTAQHTLTFINNCDETIWVGAYGQNGSEPLEGGGWEMAKNEKRDIVVPKGWNGRIFPRTDCRFAKTCSLSTDKDCSIDTDCPSGETCEQRDYCNKKRCSKHNDIVCTTNNDCPDWKAGEECRDDCCATGGCVDAHGNFVLKCTAGGNGPLTLMEPNFDVVDGKNQLEDTYDVSFVDGWNRTVMVSPKPGNFRKADPPTDTLCDGNLPRECSQHGDADCLNGEKCKSHAKLWCGKAGCASYPTCLDNMKRCSKSWEKGCSTDGDCDTASGEKCVELKFKHPDGISCFSPKQLLLGSNKYQCSCGDKCTGCGYPCCDSLFGCSPLGTTNPVNQMCNPWNSDPSRAWDSQYIQYMYNVKNACPGSYYSWQFDDPHGTWHCGNKDNKPVDYEITFCPSN